MEFKFKFYPSEEKKKAIFSLRNLKVLRGIRDCLYWDFNALFDSCGQSLEEFSINENYYIPFAALMRENLQLRHLKIEGKGRIPAEKII